MELLDIQYDRGRMVLDLDKFFPTNQKRVKSLAKIIEQAQERDRYESQVETWFSDERIDLAAYLDKCERESRSCNARKMNLCEGTEKYLRAYRTERFWDGEGKLTRKRMEQVIKNQEIFQKAMDGQ